MTTRRTNNWTAAFNARRAAALVVDVDETPVETFNELRARAKAAGVSAAGSRTDIEARLAELEG